MAGNRSNINNLLRKPPQYTPEQIAAAEEKLRKQRERSAKINDEIKNEVSEIRLANDAVRMKFGLSDEGKNVNASTNQQQQRTTTKTVR